MLKYGVDRMQLQKTRSRISCLLPSGTLIVEPDPELLAVRSSLLTAAGQYLAALNATISCEALQQIEVRLAILSQSLETTMLTTLAEEIRLYWPDASILIVGRRGLALDDQLYDESIDLSCRPEELLSALFRLAQGQRNRRAFQRVHIGTGSLSLSRLRSLLPPRVPTERHFSNSAMDSVHS
jgi:hypothetical protein